MARICPWYGKVSHLSLARRVVCGFMIRNFLHEVVHVHLTVLPVRCKRLASHLRLAGLASSCVRDHCLL